MSNKNLPQISNLQDYILPQSISFERDKTLLGPAFSRTYTIFNFPPTVQARWLEVISNYPNTIVSYQITSANVGVLLEDIQRSINAEKLKQQGQMSDIERSASVNLINEFLDLADELRINKDEAVNLTVSVTVYGDSQEALDKQSDYLISSLQSLKFIARPMNDMQEEGWINMLPINRSMYKEIAGMDMALETWVGSLGFITAQGLNDISGSFIGHDRDSGEPVFFDIWSRDNERKNANMVILGVPGAGKSTLAKLMLLNQLSRGDKLLIIDAEREYIKIAEEIGGNVIEANGATEARINPLQLRDIPFEWDDFKTKEQLNAHIRQQKSEAQRSAERTGRDTSEISGFKGPLSMHMTWLKTWFKTYIPELDSGQMALLEDAAYQMYEDFGFSEETDPRYMSPHQFPIMGDLSKTLIKANKDKMLRGRQKGDEELTIIRSLINLLQPAVSGADKFLFNGYTTVDLTSQFNVFDVHSLMEASENQKNAQFYNITTFCWLAISKDPKERVILVVDEAHLFISTKHNQVFQWLSSSSRRFRKYEGSLWILTQNVSDFFQDSVREFGEPLLNNPDNKIVLQQRSTDLRKLYNLFKISDGEAFHIESAPRGSGLMMVGNVSLFINIQPSPKVLELIEFAGGGR